MASDSSLCCCPGSWDSPICSSEMGQPRGWAVGGQAWFQETVQDIEVSFAFAIGFHVICPRTRSNLWGSYMGKDWTYPGASPILWALGGARRLHHAVGEDLIDWEEESMELLSLLSVNQLAGKCSRLRDFFCGYRKFEKLKILFTLLIVPIACGSRDYWYPRQLFIL